jgi:hypothetical protein
MAEYKTLQQNVVFATIEGHGSENFVFIVTHTMLILYLDISLTLV